MEEIKIYEGQHLEDVLPEIPANVILHKTICGCGATTMEINAPRHSIIIEPNVPVIMGKQDDYHTQIIGVMEDVNREDIVEYLTNDNNKDKKKIVTTPKSFEKVRDAVIMAGMDLHKDFFLLLDECEKIIQDSDFREKITLPIEDFFLSESKAMVSATPIEPSDPRFEQQEFKIVKIVPNYDHHQDIELIKTNNIAAAFYTILSSIDEEHRVFIFFSFIRGINELIELGDIKDKTNIYCSKDGVKELKNSGFESAYYMLTEEFNKYNFLTSRGSIRQ